MQDKPGAQKAPSWKTAYGRRVTSKTFTILGASTPENRISTMGASRKMKIGTNGRKIWLFRASVFKMHNSSSWRSRLIVCAAFRYV